MRDAFPDSKKYSKLHEILNSGKISKIDAKDIRNAGFDVIHNPTSGIGANHARLIHPDGADGFSDNNLKKLSNKFNCH